MALPKRNVAYEFAIALPDAANTGAFKANPTIAAGDFKVSTNNGALANLTTLPVVSPAGSIWVKINLSATEMNGDKILVQAIDVAGNEWDDVGTFIDATVVTVDDIVTDVLTTVMTESYAAKGAAMTLSQGVHLLSAGVGRISISGTTLTVYKLDGVTVAATYTLDNAASPTSRTRAT